MHYSLKNKKYLILSISAIILIWQGVAVSFNNRLLLPSFWDVLIEIYKIIKNKEEFCNLFEKIDNINFNSPRETFLKNFSSVAYKHYLQDIFKQYL